MYNFGYIKSNFGSDILFGNNDKTDIDQRKSLFCDQINGDC